MNDVWPMNDVLCLLRWHDDVLAPRHTPLGRKRHVDYSISYNDDDNDNKMVTMMMMMMMVVVVVVVVVEAVAAAVVSHRHFSK